MKIRYLFPLCVALLLFTMCMPAHADDTGPVFGLNLGANAVTFDATEDRLPGDYELGGTLSMSVQPHLSLVGSAWQGLARQYTRGTAGLRATASDVSNPNFNVYLGVQYEASSKKDIRPNEFVPVAGFGFKPNAAKWPWLIAGAEGGVGIDSH